MVAPMMSGIPQTAAVLHERIVDGVLIVYLERGLKGQGEATLKERLDSLVREGHREVLINLKNLPYVDSTELGRLIRAHISVRQSGGRVRLCNLSEKVKTLMKLTRLETVLDIYETEEEALAGILRKRHPDDRGAA
jgi:anti-anti-sigma factor